MLSIDRSGLILLHADGAGAGNALPIEPGQVDLADLSLDCRYLALSSNNLLTIYSLESLLPIARMSRLKGRITAMDFNPDSKSIVTARADGFIYRWKFLESPEGIQTKLDDRTLERYGGQSSIPSAILHHPFGRFFFGGDWSGNISAWLNFDADVYGGRYDENLFAGRMFMEKQTRAVGSKGDNAAASGIEHLAVTPDGNLLFAGLQGGTIQLWRVRGFDKLSETAAHPGYLYDMALNADGTKLATLGRNGSVKVWTVTREEGEKSGDQSSRLTPSGEDAVAGGRRLAFLGPQRVVVGAKDGRLVAVNILPPATPAPTPIPVSTPAAVSDRGRL